MLGCIILIQQGYAHDAGNAEPVAYADIADAFCSQCCLPAPLIKANKYKFLYGADHGQGGGHPRGSGKAPVWHQ